MLWATGRLACHRWRMLNYTSKILGYKYLPNVETIIPAVIARLLLKCFTQCGPDLDTYKYVSLVLQYNPKDRRKIDRLQAECMSRMPPVLVISCAARSIRA